MSITSLSGRYEILRQMKRSDMRVTTDDLKALKEYFGRIDAGIKAWDYSNRIYTTALDLAVADMSEAVDGCDCAHCRESVKQLHDLYMDRAAALLYNEEGH